MKYLSILTVCLGVYFLSQMLPQADGTWFFAAQGAWSVFIITLILDIERSKLTLTIASLEFFAIILNLLACFGYLTPIDFFYQQYEVILTALNITELAVLVIGVPLHGVLTRFQSLWRVTSHRGASDYRALQDNQLIHKQEWRI